MREVKVSLINGDLSETPCSLAFIKHIHGSMSKPEAAVDARTQGRLTALYKTVEKPSHFHLSDVEALSFPTLYIFNFYDDDLPFTYSSLDYYVRRMIHHALKSEGVTSIATAIHGPGCGLDASESLETILAALHRELQLRGDFGALQEIKLVEMDTKIFKRLQERVCYILHNKSFIKSRGRDYFLSADTEGETIASNQERIECLSRHLFVAMPFAKEFNNVYYFGIKNPVEQRRLKCERVDQENFTGDIVSRIKERISSAQYVIADITNARPNVFYEAGFADGLQKPVIFISQNKEIPFDVSTQRSIIYDREDILSLAEKLGETLDSLMANK